MKHMGSARVWLKCSAAAGLVTVTSAGWGSTDPRIEIRTVSSRPETVSGGDVLVTLSTPNGIRWTAQLNGRDVTQSFQRAEASGSSIALLEGLKVGSNVLTVRVQGQTRAKLQITNHPLTGPIFSGPHQQPFICQTDANGLGPALDENCSAATVVQYYYKSTEEGQQLPPATPMTNTASGTLSPGFKKYDPSAAPPADLAKIVTADARTINYIVRREIGTINRGVYDIQFVHEPGQPLPRPWARATPGWNGRLIYSFGGGCGAGYRQSTLFGTIGASQEPFLTSGYAVATSTLNILGNNCNDRLSAETMAMVKEHFAEQYGPPVHTIGWGGSGGAILQHLIAQNYPGLLDGLIPSASRPDITDPVQFFTDCSLLDRVFATSSLAWKEVQKTAVSGLAAWNTCRGALLEFLNPKNCGVRGSGGVIAPEMIYDRDKNPDGVRCDIYSNEINVLGRDPSTGFARRPLDNVGVQYGLVAFNSGMIDAEQFIDLNSRVGGYDADGNIVPRRTEADLQTLRIAYQSGFMLTGGGGLGEVPIIDWRAYGDDVLDNHLRYESYVTRARLVAAHGHADNHIIVVYPRPDIFTSFSPERARMAAVQNARRQSELVHKMSRWLDNIAADSAPGTQAQKVSRSRPADVLDVCWAASGEEIAEPTTYKGADRCSQLYPSHGDPRIAAGAPLANDVVKCTLKPIHAADYQRPLDGHQLQRLKAVFPRGVCDYSKPGIGQQRITRTWQSHGS